MAGNTGLNVIILVAFATLAAAKSTCGPSGLLNPCKCLPNGDIDCRQINSTDELKNSLKIKNINELDDSMIRNSFFMTNTLGVTKFPSALLSVLKFRHFHLFGNKGLYYVHENAFVGSEKTAKVVDLSDCNLNDSRVFDAVKTLVALETLNLSHNKLPTLPRRGLGRQPLLRKIDLSYNKIYLLGKECFRYLVSLEEVNLSHNRLFGYSGNPFSISGHQAIPMTIDISHNLISFVSEDNLKNIMHVHIFNVSYNDMSWMSEDVFVPLLNQLDFLNGDALDVTGNPINCCTTKWMSNWPQVKICCTRNKWLSEITDEEMKPSCTYQIWDKAQNRTCK